jgi:hypothetical protein
VRFCAVYIEALIVSQLVRSLLKHPESLWPLVMAHRRSRVPQRGTRACVCARGQYGSVGSRVYKGGRSGSCGAGEGMCSGRRRARGVLRSTVRRREAGIAVSGVTVRQCGVTLKLNGYDRSSVAARYRALQRAALRVHFAALQI